MLKSNPISRAQTTKQAGARAQQLGIKLVPALAINGRLLAIGVQTPEEVRDLLAADVRWRTLGLDRLRIRCTVRAWLVRMVVNVMPRWLHRGANDVTPGR